MSIFKRWLKFAFTSFLTWFVIVGAMFYTIYGFNYSNVPKDPPTWFVFMFMGLVFELLAYFIDLSLKYHYPKSKWRYIFNWSENIEDEQ